ncbi:MAG: hypothetical protein EXS14_01915 [Planctomycetes bacterium]|nr:hypothetical protein [Planctomycetota bacterium]
MRFHYAVLGSGMQGTAAAYDLGLHGEAASVLLLDRDSDGLSRSADRLRALLPQLQVRTVACDAANSTALGAALHGVQGVFSALPYSFNPAAARAAVEAGASFCDLGGNTAVVRATLELDALAKQRGVSVIPDCGLAPGLGNVLAACALGRLRNAKHVRIYCGGLPQHPQPPWDYKLVFHIGGLTNEYMGFAEVLRDGRLQQVPTLSELERVAFAAPLEQAEAFTTSGGTSTACATFLGRLDSYEYKTVRYPGHCEKVRAVRDLGLFDLDPVLVRGVSVVPRDLFHVVAAPRLAHPEDSDLVVLRAEAYGADESLRFDLLDLADACTGFSAMERCTAFPAAATLHLQVSGAVPAGATTSERLTVLEPLLAAVRKRGLDIRESSGAAR